MTQGRGVFNMTFDRYGRVPSQFQEQIVQQKERELEEEKS
jgi:translation elongation factor EF-G